jgi:CheY-like chemotaxis protein
MSHVLVAEDDRDLREVLAEMLREHGHDVIAVADGHDLAVEIAAVCRHDHPIDLVVTDAGLPGQTGLGVMHAFHGRPGCPPFIIMTGFSDSADRRQAMRLGAVGVLDKPFAPSVLLRLVDSLFQEPP